MKTKSNNYNLGKKLLKDILNSNFTLYDNGIFNALDIDEDTKDKLLNALENNDSIKYASAAFYRNDNGKKLFQIYGMINFDNITEKIELNKSLNPKIWTSDNELIPEVRQKIIDIVNHFKDQLKEDGVDLKIEDIYILGSNANFNYTKESDLDIHIIADESFDCNSNHLDIIYNAYKTLFNKKYDITLNGINAEIYVDNLSKVNTVSAGIYSLKDGWIKDPANYIIPEIDELALEKLIEKWEERYLKIIENPDLDSIETYISDIYELRKEGLSEKSEFSLGNLTFKEIRRLGYLDNLKELKDELQSKLLSI